MEDEFDLVQSINESYNVKLRPNSKLPSTLIEGKSGFGESTYDKQFFADAELNNDENSLDLVSLINENRAERQSGLTQMGALIPRALNKAATEVAKLPGVVGGIIGGAVGETEDFFTGEDNNTFLETAFNNNWIQKADELSELVNSEVLPVYVSQAVQDGNLWDKISSTSFWATEGADGIGFMAGMLAPGAIINKMSLGTRLFKGLESTGALLGKADEAANILSKAGIIPSNIELGTQTLANTLIEAGAEAKGAGDSYMMEIQEQLDNGEISIEDVNAQKAKIMQNVFLANTAILMGPNAVMSKMLWGKARNKAVGQLFNDAGEVVESVGKTTLKGKAGNIGKDIISGTTREGFFEEGLQSTAETYFNENKDSNLLDLLGDLPKAYLETVSSTEGQTAIFLGAVLGGGMQAFTGASSRKNEKETTNKLLGELHKIDSFYKTFSSDIYDDETGKKDPIKLREKLLALDNGEKLSAIFDNALESGNEDLIDSMRDYTSGEIIKPFIMNDGLGIDALKQYIETSKTLKEVSEMEEKDVLSITEPLLKKAEKLQKDYNLFKEFAPSFISLNNTEATNNDKAAYYDNINSRYISLKNSKYFFKNKLDTLNNKRKELLESLDQEEYNDQLNNFALQELSNDIIQYEKLYNNIKKEENKFWDKEIHNKEFNKLIKLRKDLEAAQEVQEEIDKTIEEVKNATTEEDVDNVKSTGTVADKAVNEQKKAKKQEIKDKKDAQVQEQVNEAINKSEESSNEKDSIQDKQAELANKISNNYNENEQIPDDILIGTEFELETALYNGETDDYISLIILDRQGEEVRIPKFVTTTSKPSTEQEFVTEGSDSHDALIPKTNENNDDLSSTNSGTKLLSTDRKGKKLFDNISDEYLNYERIPVDKVGKEVNFLINGEILDNKNWNNAIKGYADLKNGKTLTQKQIDFLIDHLPINAVVADGIMTPIETLPSTSASQEIFKISAKLLRTNIINALVNGYKIEDITSTIEGQYGGILQVSPKINNKVAENNITDLYHLKNLSEREKVDRIKKDIRFVNDSGDLVDLEGNKEPFVNSKDKLKTNTKGELYLMIPKANGKPFPLKLNIKKIQDKDAELLYQLFNMRLKDTDLNRSTTLAEIEDKEFVKNIKDNFKEEISLLGITAKDLTLRDLTDFFVYSNGKSPKSILQFTGTGKEGESVLAYGNPKINGARVPLGEELDKESFISWLKNDKRYAISFKTKKNQEHKATIETNTNYLKYLLDNKILNTNAVVNKPTFQGYTNIYLDSNNVSIKDDNIVLSKEDNARMMKEIKEKIGDPYINQKMKEGINALDALSQMNVEMADEIQAIKNKYKKIRNSQNNFVSLQDTPNTEESKQVENNKKEITNTDKLEVDNDTVAQIFKLLLDKQLIKIGSQSKKLLSGSNKENFNKLKAIADKHNVSIADITTKCA